MRYRPPAVPEKLQHQPTRMDDHSVRVGEFHLLLSVNYPNYPLNAEDQRRDA